MEHGENAGGRLHRIAVISDTHNLLRPEVASVLKTCEAVIHGGDISGPETLEKIREICGQMENPQPEAAGDADQALSTKQNLNLGSRDNSGGRLYVVRGNNDRDWAAGIPYVLEFELFGRRFCVTHKKKDIPAGTNADVVIYGHSHKYAQDCRGDVLYLNPGSCGPRRFGQAITMAVLTVKEPAAGSVAGVSEASAVTERSKAGGLNIGSTSCEGTNSGLSQKTDKKERITVERIEIPNTAGRGSRDVMVEGRQQVSGDLIARIGKDLEKGRTVADIAARRKVSAELAEEIVRLYVTHPGVTPEQVMSKMGL